MFATVAQIEGLFYVEVNYQTVWEAPFKERGPAEAMAFYIRQSYSNGQANAKAEVRRALGIEDPN